MKSGWNKKKMMSFLLAVCLLAGLMSGSALAAETEDIQEPSAEVVEVPEIKEIAEIEEIPEIEEPAEAAEPEALPEPAAEPEADGTTYTVYFKNYNGGSLSGIPSNNQLSYAAGETVKLSDYKGSTPTRDNAYTIDDDNNEMYRYSFDGWMLTSASYGDPIGKEYTRDYTVSDSFEMPDKDIYLYAHYEPIDYYHWNMTVGAGGTVRHELKSSSNAFLDIDSAYGIYKVYTNSNNAVSFMLYKQFIPVADEGYIFDGWYANGELLGVETLLAANFPALTPAMYNNQQNVIEARFKKNNGTYAQVIYKDYRVYGDYTYETVFYKQWVTVGDPMPTIDAPSVQNYYFLRWDQEIPATVPAEGITLTAQWLAGPSTTLQNTATPLYTILCDAGGTCHDDATQGMYWADSNKDIAYDEASDRYTCSITLSRIGTYIGVGPNSYDVQTGLEHKLRTSNQVVNLVWNETDGQWQPMDDTQFVYVYHESGDEGIPDSVLSAMSPIICVTDVDDPSIYKELRLIDGTYRTEMLTTTGNTRTAKVVITDFEPYAQALGKGYVPDWDSNLHEEDYYEYYLTKSRTTKSTADGHTYIAWGSWGYDKITTEFQSAGDVKHNESLYGKELLVKLPTYTLTFTDSLGALPAQTFSVKGGQQYPAYNWAAEGVDPAIAEAAQAGEPVKIDGTWYSFDGWENYPFMGFGGNVPTVSGDETFTALWTELNVITFTDGAYNGDVFDPIEFPLKEEDPLPWADYSGMEDFENSLVSGLREMQLGNGDVFVDWDRNLEEYANEHTSPTESVTFNALWAKPVTVVYLDGADGEAFGSADTFYLMGLDEEFPIFELYDEESGEWISDPVYEGHTFVDWVCIADEEASYTLVDELTGYTVNAYAEEGGFTSFEIVLEAQWKPEASDEAQLRGASLSLSGDISMKYYVSFSEEFLAAYRDTAYIEFNVNGRTTKATLDPSKTAVVGENTCYIFTALLHYSEQEKEITAKLYRSEDDQNPIVFVPYSVAAYITKLVDLAAENDQYAKAAAYAKALRVFASYSQIYCKTEADHDVSVTDEEKAAVEAVTADKLADYIVRFTNADDGAAFVASNLVLDSTIVLKLYFQLPEGAVISDYTFKNGSTVLTPTKGVNDAEGYYYVSIQNIAASEYDEVFTVTCTKNSDPSVITTVYHSALGYAYQMLSNSDSYPQNTLNVVKAMYLYYLAAKEYTA